MTQRLKFASFVLLAGAAAWLAPAARADEWNKETVMTFNEPVEIPGQVLTPGTYVFKLADSDTDREIVQVFTQNQQHLLATILAVPESRVTPTDETVVTFEERAAGAPQALHAWFYAGEKEGVEFVYRKSEAQSVATSEQPAPEPVPAPEPPAAAVTAAQPEDQASQPLVVREQEVIIAQAVAADDNPSPADTDTAPPSTLETLPQTAGNFAIIPLLGIVLLSGGLSALKFASNKS